LRRLIVAVVLAASATGGAWATLGRGESCCADVGLAKCVGKDPCPACKTCKKCGHCAAGGSCGACKK
jgi:hypothetical protein